jgi:hypothetical protein
MMPLYHSSLETVPFEEEKIVSCPEICPESLLKGRKVWKGVAIARGISRTQYIKPI